MTQLRVVGPGEYGKRREMQMRRALVGISVAVALASCGGGELSLPDYVDRVNAIVAEGYGRTEPIYIEYRNLPAPTVDDTRVLFERELIIRIDLQEALTVLDAPDQITDLHTTIVDWHAAVIEAEMALIARAGEVSGLSELEQSTESRAFDALMTEGLIACRDLQAKLDASTERGVFADTPWIPGEMKEVVNALLGCDTPISE